MVCIHVPPGPGMSATPTQHVLTNACVRAQGRIQAVADLLLLSSELRPVNTRNVTICQRSYTDCRDTVMTRTKSLIVHVENLRRLLREAPSQGWGDTAQILGDICEVVVGIIEACALGAYLHVLSSGQCQPAMPGIIDKYVICRCHAEIANACNQFRCARPEDLSPDILLSICEDMRKFLAVMTEVCSHAANVEALDPGDSDQFKLCVKSFTSCAGCFMAAVRNFKTQPSHANHRRCISFAGALTAATSATVDFATEDQFTGRSAMLTKEGKDTKRAVLGSCLQVVSSCVQMCKTVQEAPTSYVDHRTHERVGACADSITRACFHLENTLQQQAIPDTANR